MPIIVSSNNRATVVLNSRTVANVLATQNAVRIAESNSLGTTVDRTTTTNVAAAGIRGLQGEPGANGDKVIVNRITPVATGGHRIVYGASNNSVLLASSEDLVNSDNILGMTINATGIGETAQVQTYGPITEPGWNWTPGEPLFLTTNGQMTHDTPVSGVQIQLGFAESATTVFIDIDTPIYFD